jgi:hypothetical protein
MGYMVHHAIVVTSWDKRAIEAARAKAVELFSAFSLFHGEPNLVSAMHKGVVNECYSFLVAPDGSKEGWEESIVGDAAREGFVAWLEAQRHEDGSTSVHYAEVKFGGDKTSDPASVVASSD